VSRLFGACVVSQQPSLNILGSQYIAIIAFAPQMELGAGAQRTFGAPAPARCSAPERAFTPAIICDRLAAASSVITESRTWVRYSQLLAVVYESVTILDNINTPFI
jgi:hypothetical protein